MNQTSRNLARFIEAQKPVYDQVLAELNAGTKTSHWIWFIFPQVSGLGSSAMSRAFAIESISESRAFLEDPILGPRLVECTRLVLCQKERAIENILGSIDALKFRSSMTLFAAVSDNPSPFSEALDVFFDGAPDPRTLDYLRRL